MYMKLRENYSQLKLCIGDFKEQDRLVSLFSMFIPLAY